MSKTIAVTIVILLLAGVLYFLLQWLLAVVGAAMNAYRSGDGVLMTMLVIPMAAVYVPYKWLKQIPFDGDSYEHQTGMSHWLSSDSMDMACINPATGLPMMGAQRMTGCELDLDCINPATGLPMMGGMGGLDTGGNPYGTNNQDFTSHSWDCYSNTNWGDTGVSTSQTMFD